MREEGRGESNHKTLVMIFLGRVIVLLLLMLGEGSTVIRRIFCAVYSPEYGAHVCHCKRVKENHLDFSTAFLFCFALLTEATLFTTLSYYR